MRKIAVFSLLLTVAVLLIPAATPVPAQAIPPGVITYDATNVMPNSVTFNGGFAAMSAERSLEGTPVSISFQWGLSSGTYIEEVPAQFTAEPLFSADASVYGAVIYFRAKAVFTFATAPVYRVEKITLYGNEKMVVLPTGLLKPGQPTGGAGGGQGGPVGLTTSTVKSATLSATKVTPGTPVTVNATVENSGTVNGSSMIKLYVNGQEEASRGVTVASGSSTPVSFTVSRNEPGTYSVYVGGAPAGSFTVDTFADGNMILYITGGLMLIVLIGGLVYFTRRRV